MLLKRDIKRAIFLVLCTMLGLCALAGCGRHDYKAEADEQVYGIIDRKWKDEFGPKVNYKVSDTEPATGSIEIEKAVPASGVLTLSQAVALATAHNRDYQAQKEALYIKALDLGLTRHEFETQFFGKPKYLYTKVRGELWEGVGAGIDPRIDSGRLAPRVDLDLDRFRIEDGFGFDRLLAQGARIGTNLAVAWGRMLTGADEGERFLSVLSAEVVLPLVRGSEPAVVLENLTQAERDTLYQLRSFSRFRKTFVVSIVTQYYRVLQLLDKLNNAEDHFNGLSWLQDRVEKLIQAGRLPKLEAERVRQERLRAQDIYLQAEKEYKQALDEFKITLSLPTTGEFQLDESELKALRAAGIPPPDFSGAEALETALRLRLDLANSADVVADGKRKVYVAADQLKAELNLGLSTNVPLQDLTGTKDPDLGVDDMYMAGLELDLPWDRVAEQNVYRKALITLNQRQREYELATDTVALEVRRAYRDLTEAAKRYQVQSDALELAKKRFNNTFLLMQYGRASSRRVLRAQEDFFEVQNAATEALVNYIVATLNFYRDTGVLQVRPDGMWQR